MSALSSANFTEGNIVLKERTQTIKHDVRPMCISSEIVPSQQRMG